MLQAVMGVLAALTAWFSVIFVKDISANKKNLESNSWFVLSGIGFITNFFDTLGIGSFAPTTALLKFTKQTKDRVLPGTLNVACTIPVVIEAFIFIKVIKVDAITLVAMLVASVFGAWFGAGIVAKLPEKKIQGIMAVALAITATLMLAGIMGWMPGGGDQLATAFEGTQDSLIYQNVETTIDGEAVLLGTPIGVTGIKLVIAVIVNFILGALMTAGIGLYAPCMALVYLLGMSPTVAFPIMMGSCAFLMPAASAKFVKEGAYDRKAAVAIAIAGSIGVYIAANFVSGMPMDVLKKMVIGVIYITSASMFYSLTKNKDNSIDKAA